MLVPLEVAPGRPTHHFFPSLICWNFIPWSDTARDTSKCSPQLGGPMPSSKFGDWMWRFWESTKRPQSSVCPLSGDYVAGWPGGSQTFRRAGSPRGQCRASWRAHGSQHEGAGWPRVTSWPAGLPSCSRRASAHQGVALGRRSVCCPNSLGGAPRNRHLRYWCLENFSL